MTRGSRVAAVAVLGILVSGCGSASEPSPPTGVDQLVIPSPSLDPADFVASIDNQWLPLALGSEWKYRATSGGELARITVTVLDETREVQGVAATVVLSEVVNQRGRVVDQTREWFAQDVDGNVWRVGEDGVWEAGVGGAEAGLAMPARPRVGDGYRQEYAEGVAEDRTEVLGLDGSASVPYGDLTGLLETEDSSPLEPGVVELRSYARGIGLVRVAKDDEGDELALVAFVSAAG
ncbi:hypothetical protein D0Z08_03150 [Nocardioides immobilis]|uniref:Uncharacterized protein n=1 Tax=Nocardioides immobilis TaxID=2049295 RepID=A0A417Y8F0_9ACTN|nr:hypothetical protein [Nocardioides immobilis]RHW28855.1 hypothetical protein D0Z08_03150 [Nocardioides immobilis]